MVAPEINVIKENGSINRYEVHGSKGLYYGISKKCTKMAPSDISHGEGTAARYLVHRCENLQQGM